MAGVGVIGAHETVLPFKAFGFSVWPAGGREEALRAWTEARAQELALVVLTEDVARVLAEEIREADPLPSPAVVLIPGAAGPTGYALERVRRMAEMAIGTDVIGKGEQEAGGTT